MLQLLIELSYNICNYCIDVNFNVLFVSELWRAVNLRTVSIFNAYCLFFAMMFCTPINAKVFIHTDNEADLINLKENQPLSLSTETNLLVLDLSHEVAKLELAPLKRSLKFMDDGESVCVINKIKTKAREKKYLFSKPINLFFNRRLYQADHLKPLFLDGPIDLYELFTFFPNRKLVVSSQMSYGDELDKQISKLPAQNVIVRQSGLQGLGIIEMLSQQRVDYAIINPQEINDLPFEFDATSYEIAGVSPFILGRLMCADTPATQQYIARLNQRIDETLKDKRLYKAHLNFISDKERLYFEHYYYQAFYGG